MHNLTVKNTNAEIRAKIEETGILLSSTVMQDGKQVSLKKARKATLLAFLDKYYTPQEENIEQDSNQVAEILTIEEPQELEIQNLNDVQENCVLEEFTQKMTLLQEQYELLVAKNTELEAENAELVKRNDTLVEDNARLKEEYNDLINEKEECEGYCRELEESKEILKNNEIDYEGQIEKLKNDATYYKSEMQLAYVDRNSISQTLKNEKQIWKNNSEKLSQKNLELKEKIENLTQELGDMQAQKFQKMSKINTLKNKLEQYQKNVITLLKSGVRVVMINQR